MDYDKFLDEAREAIFFVDEMGEFIGDPEEDSPAARFLAFVIPDENIFQEKMNKFSKEIQRLGQEYGEITKENRSLELEMALPSFAFSMDDDCKTLLMRTSNDEAFNIARKFFGRPNYQIHIKDLIHQI